MSARFARGTTARARFTRRLPSNGRSRRTSANQPFESSVALSRAASSHARHAHVVLLARSFIDTHTHAHTHYVMTRTCPTDRVSDRPRVRPTKRSTTTRPLARRRVTSHRPPTPAADARRAHHTHTRVRISRARPLNAHRTTRRRFVRYTRPIAPADPSAETRTHTRGHRARTARPPPSSSVRTNVEHSF